MADPLLEARDLVKAYGHVNALSGANFALHEGEVVALIGDNGAGKSTLVKCLSGAEAPDAGEIRFAGRPVTLSGPTAARRLGIETVFQDLALAPDLDPAMNLFLGRELFRPGVLGRLGVLDRRRMRAEAEEAFGSLGITLRRLRTPIATLSGGQRQAVAVARAVAWATKVVFMDEPTAALGVVQTARVLDLIKSVRDSGIAVVLVSHNMPQVVEIADRVEVLRLGQRVAVFDHAEATVERLVTAMTSGEARKEDAA